MHRTTVDRATVDRAAAFETHRAYLFAIAYRMLGSAADAEDVVQDAFVRWHEAPATDVAVPRAWLSTVVTRLAIDHLRSARAQREQYVGPWLPEPLVGEAVTSGLTDGLALAESLSMAFLAVLEQLGPVERAVFLLHEVFDYDHAEVARVVGRTETACRQILHRARRRVRAERPRARASREEQQRLTHQFLATLATGDVPALARLLAADVTVWTDSGGRTRAARRVIRGADRTVRYLVGVSRKATGVLASRFLPVNGEPGVVVYVDGQPSFVLVLDVADGRVGGIRIVINPDKLATVPPLQ